MSFQQLNLQLCTFKNKSPIKSTCSFKSLMRNGERDQTFLHIREQRRSLWLGIQRRKPLGARKVSQMGNALPIFDSVNKLSTLHHHQDF